MTDPKSNLLNLKLQSSAPGREADLHARLQKVAADVSDIKKALALFRILTTEYLRCIGAAHLTCSNGLWSADRTQLNGQLSGEELTTDRLQAVCRQAVEQNKQIRLGAESSLPFDYFVTPINSNDRKFILLVKRRPLSESEQIGTLLNMLRMVATSHELWFARSEALKQTELLEASSAVIELVSAVEQSDSIAHACHAITQETKRFLNSMTACIGILKGTQFATAANSEASSFDQNSELFKFYESSWQEASLKSDLSVWPPGENDSRHGLIQHRKLVERLRLGAAVSVPLKNDENETIGVLTVVGNVEELTRDISVNFLRCAGSRLGNAIELLSRAEEGPVKRIASSIRNKAGRRKAMIASVTAAVLGAILLVPVPYRVRCQCETDALVRRYAAAPFDGVIKQGFVRAGDIVRPGEQLAEMNGREITQELARATFEKHRAEKKQNLYLAQDNVADSLLAGMEAESLSVSKELLETKKSNLSILAPIEGVILNGDLDEAQDMPVKVGQTLFEIGALDPIKIQIAIPTDEIANVRTGMDVRVWLSGFGSKSLSGHIEKILPDAEIRDDKHVFLAEVVVKNPNDLLRPGMRGSATVTCDAHSLGWNLFHKPWEYVASRMSW